jgi:hypothetical protein
VNVYIRLHDATDGGNLSDHKQNLQRGLDKKIFELILEILA